MKLFRKLIEIVRRSLSPHSHRRRCSPAPRAMANPIRALASGMNWGIFTLLGVVLTVLTCIAFSSSTSSARKRSAAKPAPVNPP